MDVNEVLADLGPYLPGFVQGLWTTVWIGVASILTMFGTGTVLFLALRSPSPVIQRTVIFFIEFLRSGSAVVGVFWAFFALPLFVPGLEFTGAASALIVLGVSGGAFAAEIIRGAAKGIPASQLDSCDALNYGFWNREGRIVLPQAVTAAMPSLSSLSIEVFKWTAVVSLVAVPDFLYWIGVARGQTGHTVLLYVLAILVYFALGRLIALLYRTAGTGLATDRRRRMFRRAPTMIERCAMPIRFAEGNFSNV